MQSLSDKKKQDKNYCGHRFSIVQVLLTIRSHHPSFSSSISTHFQWTSSHLHEIVTPIIIALSSIKDMLQTSLVHLLIPIVFFLKYGNCD